MCVAFVFGNGSSVDAVVLNQVDSWPSCDNFIALSKSAEYTEVAKLRDVLEGEKVESAMNKLERVICDRIH